MNTKYLKTWVDVVHYIKTIKNPQISIIDNKYNNKSKKIIFIVLSNMDNNYETDHTYTILTKSKDNIIRLLNKYKTTLLDKQIRIIDNENNIVYIFNI